MIGQISKKWRSFKSLYCEYIKEYTANGLITGKTKRANSIVNQEAINLQTISCIEDVQEMREQLDDVTDKVTAMSAVTPNTHHQSTPVYSPPVHSPSAQ